MRRKGRTAALLEEGEHTPQHCHLQWGASLSCVGFMLFVYLYRQLTFCFYKLET